MCSSYVVLSNSICERTVLCALWMCHFTIKINLKNTITEVLKLYCKTQMAKVTFISANQQNNL